MSDPALAAIRSPPETLGTPATGAGARRLVLRLASATRTETVDDVVSFVGRDASGKFGLLPGAERTIASLEFGLASFRRVGGITEYVALPGAVLHFEDPHLSILARRFLRSRDQDELAAALDRELRAEEEKLGEIRESLHRLDEAMIRHMLELARGGAR